MFYRSVVLIDIFTIGNPYQLILSDLGPELFNPHVYSHSIPMDPFWFIENSFEIMLYIEHDDVFDIL